LGKANKKVSNSLPLTNNICSSSSNRVGKNRDFKKRN